MSDILQIMDLNGNVLGEYEIEPIPAVFQFGLISKRITEHITILCESYEKFEAAKVWCAENGYMLQDWGLDVNSPGYTIIAEKAITK